MSAPVNHIGNCYLISSHRLERELSTDVFDIPQPHLQQRNPASGGRAQVFFIELGSERAVLRHYYRGGMIAKFTDDHFLWTGINNTRAVREYRLLEWMTEKKLPVPVPLAARIIRSGAFYTCDLITREVVESETLATKLQYSAIDNDEWHRIGVAIKKLHNHNVWHSDLNANNILLTNTVTVIDFDRCRIRPDKRNDKRWQQDNIARLHRSLDKLTALGSIKHFTVSGWQALLSGYEG